MTLSYRLECIHPSSSVPTISITLSMCRFVGYISLNPILLDDVLTRPTNAITQQLVGDVNGVTYANADGFGISWYTDARSDFNPFLRVPDAQSDSNPGPFNPRVPDVQSDSNPSKVGRTPHVQVEAKNPVHIFDGPILPFVHGPHPAIYKTVMARPTNDPCFISLCANASSKCILGHLRGATNPPVATTHNHPFIFGRHAFMHNGCISNFTDVRHDMLRYISEGFTAMIESGTDTEHFAAMYLTNLCDPKDFRGVEKHYPVAEMWDALKATIQMVEDIQRKRGLQPENYFNVCATDGESLLGLCYSSGDLLTVPLWVSVDAADVLDRRSYGFKYGKIYEDTRSPEEIALAARQLGLTAKPVIDRSPLTGDLGIQPDLEDIFKKEKTPNNHKHGPHVIVASEPLTLEKSEWFRLFNREAILVEIEWKWKNGVQEGYVVQELTIRPETLGVPIIRDKEIGFTGK